MQGVGGGGIEEHAADDRLFRRTGASVDCGNGLLKR